MGFAIGCKELISDLNTMKFSFNPYNVNRLSIIAGAAAMNDKNYFLDCTKKIIETREWFKSELSRIGFTFTNSKANFILAKHNSIDGKNLYISLKEKGVLVRYLGGKISDYVRITIGSREQMETLLKKIKEVLF